MTPEERAAEVTRQIDRAGAAIISSEARRIIADAIREAEVAVGTNVGADLLVDCAQIIDTIRQEWSQDGSWSEWDQGVRDRITAALGVIYARSAVGANVGAAQPEPYQTPYTAGEKDRER